MSRLNEVNEATEIGEVGGATEVAMLRAELDSAAQMLAARNYPQAELYLRRYLRFGGRDPAAPALMAAVARGFGLPESFELVEDGRPGDAGAGATGTARPRHLLIKAWGCGFWSDVHHVVGQLLVAELTQRIPVVRWGANSLFGDASGAEAFGLYFEPVGAELPPLDAATTIFPAKWTVANLADDDLNKWHGPDSRVAAQSLFCRTEDIVVSDFYATVSSLIPWIGRGSRYHGLTDDRIYALLFARHLRPLPAIRARVDAFWDRHMAGRPWVALHVRGSDKVFESAGLHQTNLRYFGFVDRIVELNPGIGVFLLTDSVDVHAAFGARYAGLLATPALRSRTTTGVHMLGHSGRTVGDEVLIDALLAARCDYFVGNQESNVSLAVASLKDWPQGFLALLGEKNGRAENLFLHRPAEPPVPAPAPVLAPVPSPPEAAAVEPAVEVAPCRLCGSPTEPMFELDVLARHRVGYHRCGGCGALQTDAPHWLAEAYAADPERFDTGKASRTLVNFLALPPLLAALQVRKSDRAVDFGGGTGLLARLLRDVGHDFRSCDKYGGNEFMAGLAWSGLDRPCRLVTIFEVAEHFADPRADWAAIFAADPDVVIGSTGLYLGQGADWAYLSPESGQHVFFYSPRAIETVARQHGRHAVQAGMYFIISRAPLPADTAARVAAWRDDLMPACRDSFEQWARAPYEHATNDNRQVVAFERLRRDAVRIAVDGVFFRFATGIARVWKSLLAEWSASGFGEFVVVVDRDRTAPRHPGIAYVDAPQHQYADPAADRRMLQDICDRERIDLFVSTYYSTPLTTPAALMVLDMIPEVMGIEKGFDLANPQWVEKHHAIAYADSYLAISDSTARDLVRLFPAVAPESVVTAHCGSDFRAASAERVQALRTKFGISRPYFLISGVRADYKNAALFFKAFERLGEARAGYAVVCTNAVGPLDAESAARAGAAAVHMLVLSDDELQSAYSGALALAFPSRYEGFGLPVLEAMACGCPVITAATSSIPEIGGDAVIYVDCDDVAAMLAAIGAVQHAPTRAGLIERGLARAGLFSWRRMADEVAAALGAQARRASARRTQAVPGTAAAPGALWSVR